jgi:hypothetical protein
VWLADSAFFDVWAISDGPVAMQMAGRSWLWGPLPFAVANEAYAESPTGKRLVEYLDKGRMEVNDPRADRASNWFVTSGLLVSEMVTGRVQTGDSAFETRAPAQVPVAGDAQSPNAPSYADFAALTAPIGRATGSLAQQAISKDGSVRPLEAPAPGAGSKASMLGTYDEVSGHNVPAIFTDWLEQTGAILQGGRLAQGRIMDPLFVLGRPITEAYWADVLVAGVPARVLVQLFERRSLTYNPANPPQWQVEMANVGRAYYDWRYGSDVPGPAISAELVPSGLQLRGWNWPTHAGVELRVELAGAVAPISGPFGLRANQAGMFAIVLPVNLELEGALLAGANLRTVAASADMETALPLAARIRSGNATVEGLLTAVQQAPSGAYSLLMKDYAGKEWQVSLFSSAAVYYSEGGEAQAAQLTSGEYARVEGSVVGDRVNAGSVRLMSVSSTGARLGYELQPGGREIRLSGTNWPAKRDVTFSLRPSAGEGGVQLGSARADSRGNVFASFDLPSATPADQPLWFFAQVAEKDTLLAQVAMLYPPGGAAQQVNGLPTLMLLGSAGEQMGGMGSYCLRGECVPAIGVPVPGEVMLVASGEVLGLRSQFGLDPDLGVSPQRFTTQLYAYPAEPASEGALIDGTFYFSPTSLPVFTTGEVPGRPFSVTLPPVVAPGKYLLLLSVVWSDVEGARDEAVYGFALEVQ